MKSALVLEGGAKRGIYTAGVLDVLLENEILTDAVFGVSAGAVHGCSYASMQHGRSIRYTVKYNNDYRFMSWRSFFKSGSVVDTKFSYHELPEKLDPYDNHTFQKQGIEFYAVASDLKTGRPEYLKCTDMFADIDCIRASASMPFVAQIVKTRNKHLLDGGITDSIPIQKALDMGFDKNIVVLTRPLGYRKKPMPWFMKILAKRVYKKYPKFIQAMFERYQMYNNQVDFVADLQKQGKIIVIRPSRFIDISRMETNLDTIKQMYQLGREDAQQMLPQIKAFLKKKSAP
jgi:predicted patatin/cPLA2 family phospholipase